MLANSNQSFSQAFQALHGLVVIGFLCVVATPAPASTTWTGDINDFFNEPGNWTDGVPGGTDTAFFDLPGATTVDFDVSPTVGEIRFVPGADPRTVQFNFSGEELVSEIGNSTSLGDQTIIFDGGRFEQNTTLTLSSGNLTDETFLRLRNEATMFTSSWLRLGDTDGRFAMEVVEGSQLDVLRLQMAVTSGSSANLTISGVGTELVARQTNNAGNNLIGDSGTGELIIENGGLFQAGRRTKVGDGGDGTLIVRGSGLDEDSNVVYSTITASGAHSGLFLRGDRSTPAGSGTAYALFQDGGRGIFADGFIAHPGSTLEIDRGYLTVTEGTSREARRFSENSELIYWLYSGETDARINITGPLEIENATLSIELDDDFSAALGEEFLLIGYGTTLDGTFAGLAQNTVFSVDDYYFQISYDFLDASNDEFIALTVVPEPGSVGLLLLAGMAGLMRRNRRRLVGLPRA